MGGVSLRVGGWDFSKSGWVGFLWWVGGTSLRVDGWDFSSGWVGLL